jgi:formate dehydrogenase
MAAPAAVTVRVCDGLSCELAGAQSLLALLRSGGYGDGVRIITAPCVGRCDTAPVAVVQQNPLDHATVAAVDAALADQAFSAPVPDYTGYVAYVAAGGYALLEQCRAGARTADDVIATMEQAGLRGLGGAGFPAGRKWKIVRAEPAPKLMAVNIDEGEPGTFKDRYYLERDPHRFLEGMLIAAWAVGIDRIYIYLRDEYAAARDILTRELAALAANAPFPLPPIELRRGAGAYICGEESAMIESIEGKKGMPRLRPPYVAQVGLFGRPTLEHNMETLYWVRAIVERGAEWFSSQGRNGRTGLRSFSVSGRVRTPGVHLAPAGITMRELLEEYAGGMLPGHAFYGYFPGGASGGILPATMDDIPLDFDTLNKYGCFIGSAAIIVLSDRDTAKDAALNMLRFFREESCGQCTPCRVGTAKAVALMEREQWDEPLLTDLSRVMIDASICGLGQAAANPFLSVYKYFPHEVAG